MIDLGINDQVPYFGEEGLSCAESTLRYLIEHGVVDLPLTTVRMMNGMHGNMGRCANCGAVNGGVAAIGAKLGRLDPEEDSTHLYETVERFMQEFETCFGSVKCKELVGDNDQASVEQQKRCAEYVLGATEIVTRLLAEETK